MHPESLTAEYEKRPRLPSKIGTAQEDTKTVPRSQRLYTTERGDGSETIQNWTGLPFACRYALLIGNPGRRITMTVVDIAESLGVGGEAIRSEADLVEVVSRGLPTLAVDAVVHSGILSADEADRLIISRQALVDRSSRGLPLTADESDRLVRVARVNAIATEQFGNAGKAARWLRKPNRVLDERVPLELLQTGEGARLVEETIMRIAHGIFF
jgi:putative toxin-antitoxin system antitoxin component (TIGR02293 family)